MNEHDLWARGLMTSGLGPEPEWDPVPPTVHQRRHDTFWKAITNVLPDEESDEAYWMTEDASSQLRNN